MMKSFSEEAATEVESTPPQVSGDSVIFVAGFHGLDPWLS